ncbi:MAG: hypothetical protein ACTSWN_16140 [Promethearchaeota archaeon]
MTQDTILILIIFACFILGIFIVRYLVLRSKGNLGNKKTITKEYIEKKFFDMISLRAILVIKKDSGILLYSYIVESDDDSFKLKNPEFISAVLNAMRSLGRDMGFKGQEFCRLQFGDYYIVSNYGHHCQAVLVSRSEPSSIMEDNLFFFVKSFEKKFFGVFLEKKSFIKIDDFKSAIDLVREVFDTYFIEGINLLYDPKLCAKASISPLGKIILDRALDFFNKNKVLILKQLFIDLFGEDDSEIKKKYTRKDVLYEMYKLYENNYFTYFNE